jgi:hypothetical protein
MKPTPPEIHLDLTERCGSSYRRPAKPLPCAWHRRSRQKRSHPERPAGPRPPHLYQRIFLYPFRQERFAVAPFFLCRPVPNHVLHASTSIKIFSGHLNSASVIIASLGSSLASPFRLKHPTKTQSYCWIAESTWLGVFPTWDGVGNCELSQPPPSALINATAPIISEMRTVITACWSVSKVVWAVTTST